MIDDMDALNDAATSISEGFILRKIRIQKSCDVFQAAYTDSIGRETRLHLDRIYDGVREVRVFLF